MVNSSSQLRILLFMILTSILPKSCTSSTRAAFMPRTKIELKSAVGACLKLLPKCDCSISSWDVSRVTDMSGVFANAQCFNGDISKWDVSNVRDMSGMFQGATSFNRDISKWEVSSVSNMNNMFWNAASFKQNLCGARWVHSQATKTDMFEGSFGSISREVCAPALGGSLPQRRTFASRTALKSAVDNYAKCERGGKLVDPGNPFLKEYLRRVSAGQIREDQRQVRCLQLFPALAASASSPRSSTEIVGHRGIYLWGGVGT